MDSAIAPELKAYYARKAKSDKDDPSRKSLKRSPGALPYRGRVGAMPRYSLDGDGPVRREPQPEPPPELLRAIDQLAVKARALDEEHDRVVDGVAALRRRLREAEGGSASSGMPGCPRSFSGSGSWNGTGTASVPVWTSPAASGN